MNHEKGLRQRAICHSQWEPNHALTNYAQGHSSVPPLTCTTDRTCLHHSFHADVKMNDVTAFKGRVCSLPQVLTAAAPDDPTTALLLYPVAECATLWHAKVVSVRAMPINATDRHGGM